VTFYISVKSENKTQLCSIHMEKAKKDRDSHCLLLVILFLNDIFSRFVEFDLENFRFIDYAIHYILYGFRTF
jgi:hypothetical protein